PMELALPDGSALRYTPASPGAGAAAEFEHVGTPTAFYRSTVSSSLFGARAITFVDGSGYDFGPGLALHSTFDRFLRSVVLARADDQFQSPGAGDIVKISSSGGRVVELTYDSQHRIASAQDNIGRTVRYAYDPAGRLVAVTDAEGGVTGSTYDSADRMSTVQDARGVVTLTNEYSADGRVSRQVLADQGAYTFSYLLDANGRVARTEVTDPRGVVRRVTFDSRGYALSDTRAL